MKTVTAAYRRIKVEIRVEVVTSSGTGLLTSLGTAFECASHPTLKASVLRSGTKVEVEEKRYQPYGPPTNYII